MGDFTVTGNAALPTCEAIELRDQVQSATGIGGDVSIVDNLVDTCSP